MSYFYSSPFFFPEHLPRTVFTGGFIHSTKAVICITDECGFEHKNCYVMYANSTTSRNE